MNNLINKTTLKFIILLIVVTSFNTFKLSAQNNQTAFDSAYQHIVMNVASQDLDKAIAMTDSLNQHSQSKLQTMKCYLLLALLSEEKGNIVDALAWTTKVEEIAIAEKNYEYQVRASGYLATLYRRVDLTKESNRHIVRAEKANSYRKSEKNYFDVQSVIHHEKSMHEIEVGNYEKALKELQKSEDFLNKTEDSPLKDFSMVALYESFAECYIGLKLFDKAKEKALVALEKIGDNDHIAIGLLHNYLAVIAMDDKDYKQAFEHLQIAEEYANRHENLSYQFTVYSNLKQYYIGIQDYEKVNYYNDLVNSVSNRRTKNIKQVSNEILTKLHLQEEEINKEKLIYIWISLFLIVAIISIIVVNKVVRKRRSKQYNIIINRLAEMEAGRTVAKKNDERKSADSVNSQKGVILLKETETRLLEKLNELEKSHFYLNKNISLSSLAAEMNSNTKYVSHIINTQKNKDFTSYINELRIFFVVQQFRDNSDFSKYKLAFIAETAGFSSHSKFTAIFRNITGLTPSVLIAQLEKERKNEANQAI